MTSQYVTEPPTSGLVALLTSKGEITIELFSHQTPLASRNFLTLALENFYTNLIFHRLIPGFIIQSGDPSGTGTGGESIYGSPYAIEPHSRLKFNRRGLLGMAADEEKKCESQFFLTLDAAPELDGKHTLLGRVVGDGIYRLVEMAEAAAAELVGAGGDRPRYPPRLRAIKVLENPFGDLKPRLRVEERQEAPKQEEKGADKGKKKKKNTALLSFGAEEDAGEERKVWKGPMSSHDFLKEDTRLSSKPMEKVERERERPKERRVEVRDPSSTTLPSTTPAPTKPVNMNGTASTTDPPQPPIPSAQSKPTSNLGRELLAKARSKYVSSSKGKSDSYDALLSFQSRLRSQPSSHSSKRSPYTAQAAEDDQDEEDADKEYGASDDDTDWRDHRLDAGGKALASGGDGGGDRVDDYEVLDPREHKANGMRNDETEQRRGKRGRDWVEDERRYHSSGRRDSDRNRDRNTNRDSDRNRHSGSSSDRHHHRR